MFKYLIAFGLVCGFGLHSLPAAAKLATGVDAEKADKNRYDFFKLRAEVTKYQDALKKKRNGDPNINISTADIQKALAELKKDGFRGITEPSTLTADQAEKMQVEANNTCGIVRIIGPGGTQVTGYGIQYSNPGQKAAALSRASLDCVSGFKPIAIDAGSSH